MCVYTVNVCFCVAQRLCVFVFVAGGGGCPGVFMSALAAFQKADGHDPLLVVAPMRAVWSGQQQDEDDC